MKPTVYLGVDPGASGAIAALFPDGRAAWVKLAETPADVAAFVRDQLVDHEAVAAVEKVGAMPRQGVASTFKFGWSAGFVEGLLVAYGVRFSHVTPAKWQAALSCRTGGDKNISKRRAQELWPAVKVTHAIADALLLAEYARRTA
jgi:crossover junction endodeoxyribonuclease RuvC